MPHTKRLPKEQLYQLILEAIKNASLKSSREMLQIPAGATAEDLKMIYADVAWELMKYFREYPTDPAGTAHQMLGKSYRQIGAELFRNRSVQKERMNSAWRYQYLAVACASASNRFRQISDIGTSEADFVVLIDPVDASYQPISLYVSVKNRSDTMGGQDWPKAIRALEEAAIKDKNRVGPYCCVFGLAMDAGTNERRIIRDGKKGTPHSSNTEVWRSNFFWPFFTNYSYEEIMAAVLDVLIDISATSDLPIELDVPPELLNVFGDYCYDAGLINESGNFHNPHALVQFLCSPKMPISKKKSRS